MSSDHRDGITIKFFFHLINQTSVHGWGYWNMIWTHRFYFSSYSAVVCHKLSRFNSRIFTLGFTWDSCRLLGTEKFLRKSGQFKWVTRETRYHISITELLKRNLLGQVAKLFGRFISSISMRKVFYDWGRKHFRGGIIGTGEALSAKLSTGETTEAS